MGLIDKAAWWSLGWLSTAFGLQFFWEGGRRRSANRFPPHAAVAVTLVQSLTVSVLQARFSGRLSGASAGRPAPGPSRPAGEMTRMTETFRSPKTSHRPARFITLCRTRGQRPDECRHYINTSHPGRDTANKVLPLQMYKYIRECVAFYKGINSAR